MKPLAELVAGLIFGTLIVGFFLFLDYAPYSALGALIASSLIPIGILAYKDLTNNQF